jgi:hypothetical protein
MNAPEKPVVLLPCPFCGDVGRCGPDGAYYFKHAEGCWIRSQRGMMLDCVSFEELGQWNIRIGDSCHEGCKIKRAVKQMSDNLTTDYKSIERYQSPSRDG